MAANTVNSLADRIPAALGTKAVYGEAIELGDTTLIPVAYTAFGFGSGEGVGTNESGAQESGTGGGGGGVSIPIGAYVSRSGDTHFEPNLIALLAVGIPFVFVTGRALARVVRALKH
ncbi:MAG: GerW family sporulation protein [Agromyces sp.]